MAPRFTGKHVPRRAHAEGFEQCCCQEGCVGVTPFVAWRRNIMPARKTMAWALDLSERRASALRPLGEEVRHRARVGSVGPKPDLLERRASTSRSPTEEARHHVHTENEMRDLLEMGTTAQGSLGEEVQHRAHTESNGSKRGLLDGKALPPRSPGAEVLIMPTRKCLEA